MNQDYKNWELIISDDSSQDNTSNISEKFALRDKRITLISQKNNHGALENFKYLLLEAKKRSDCSFFMLSDQDDVWLPHKISVSVNRIKMENQSLPVLVYTNKQYVDEQLQYINYNIKNQDKICMQLILHQNPVFGCTVIFNSELLNKITTIPIAFINHDHYLAVLAYIYGKVIYLDDKTILYRQHRNNTSGDIRKGLIEKVFNRKLINNNIVLFEYITKYVNSQKIHLKKADEKIITLLLKGFNGSNILLIIMCVIVRIRKNTRLGTLNFYFSLLFRK